LEKQPLTQDELTVLLSDLLGNLLAALGQEVVYSIADLKRSLWDVQVRMTEDGQHVVANAVRSVNAKDEVLDLDHYLNQVVKENVPDDKLRQPHQLSDNA
jgi:hypothetical protein